MRDSVRQKRAETLAGGALEVDADGIVRQAVGAVPPRHFAAEHRADGAVRVADRQLISTGFRDSSASFASSIS